MRPHSPTAETADLKSVECRFESDCGYQPLTKRNNFPGYFERANITIPTEIPTDSSQV